MASDFASTKGQIQTKNTNLSNFFTYARRYIYTTGLRTPQLKYISKIAIQLSPFFSRKYYKV